MADFRYNGRTFSVESALLPPGNVQYVSVIYGPYFDQGAVVLVDPTSPGQPIQYRRYNTAAEAIEAGKQAIRERLGAEEPFLKQFMNQLKEFQILCPLCEMQLLITPVAKLDWRKLTKNTWEQAGWTGEDQDLTSIDRSDEVFLAALKRRLRRVGILNVTVTNDVPYMEIVRLKEEG